MAKSVVSVIKATPETILEAVSKAMRDSGYLFSFARSPTAHKSSAMAYPKAHSAMSPSAMKQTTKE